MRLRRGGGCGGGGCGGGGSGCCYCCGGGRRIAAVWRSRGGGGGGGGWVGGAWGVAGAAGGGEAPPAPLLRPLARRLARAAVRPPPRLRACHPRSRIRTHVSQLALERTRTPPHSAVFTVFFSVVFTRCSEDAAQYRLPALMLAYSARRPATSRLASSVHVLAIGAARRGGSREAVERQPRWGREAVGRQSRF